MNQLIQFEKISDLVIDWYVVVYSAELKLKIEIWKWWGEVKWYPAGRDVLAGGEESLHRRRRVVIRQPTSSRTTRVASASGGLPPLGSRPALPFDLQVLQLVLNVLNAQPRPPWGQMNLSVY